MDLMLAENLVHVPQSCKHVTLNNGKMVVERVQTLCGGEVRGRERQDGVKHVHGDTEE